MAETTDLPNVAPGDEAKSATQLGLLLDAAKHLVDEQSRIGERLDAKSRNQLAIAATFFVGVQAGVITLVNGILGPTRTGDSSAFVPYLAGGAAVAAIALVVAVVLSYRVWRLRPEKSISTKTIRDYISYAREGRFVVGANLVWAYTQVVDARLELNVDRARATKRAGWACLAAIFVAGVELILAFAAVSSLR